jgi:hypothetical protein
MSIKFHEYNIYRYLYYIMQLLSMFLLHSMPFFYNLKP